MGTINIPNSTTPTTTNKVSTTPTRTGALNGTSKSSNNLINDNKPNKTNIANLNLNNINSNINNNKIINTKPPTLTTTTTTTTTSSSSNKFEPKNFMNEDFSKYNNINNNINNINNNINNKSNPNQIIENIKQQHQLQMFQQKMMEQTQEFQDKQLKEFQNLQKKMINGDENDSESSSDEEENLSPRTLRELKNIQRMKNLEKFSPSYLISKKSDPYIKSLPKFSEWSKERPFLNYGYLSNISTKYTNTNTNLILPGKYENTKIELNQFPNYFKEQILIEDLLSTMIGIEGEVIHVSLQDTLEDDSLQSNLIKYVIEGEIDSSSNDLVQRILPLCSYYTFVNDFINIRYSYEWGLINHSLCSSIDQLLKEYLILVSQLESQLKSEKLSLQRMWFYLQPTIATFEILFKVTSEIMRNNSHGAQVINLLWKLQSKHCSDKKSEDLFCYLIRASTEPFLEMLDLWIHHGIIRDPYFEFMIEENKELKRDNINRDFNDIYWEERYILRENQIPNYLKSIANKVLTTGKYLNVVKECNQISQQQKDRKEQPHHHNNNINKNNSNNKNSKTYKQYQQQIQQRDDYELHMPLGYECQIEFSKNEKNYIDKIEKAYDYTSGTLLNLLINEKQLIARLKSIKHYFLLCKGDFFSHFMEITYDELKKPLDEINMVKMNSLLQLSLRTTSISEAEEDEFKDDLECEFIPYKLKDQLLNIININEFNNPTTKSNTTTSSTSNTINSNNNDQNNISTITTDKTINTTLITSKSAHEILKTNNLFGIESLAFNYNVGWPLSLIIGKKSIIKYQIIFRHLFLCKHVEKILVDTWSQHQIRRKFANKPGLSTLLSFTHLLRHRMINFLQNLEYYMMLEVLEPNWNKMKNSIKTSKTVDDVIRIHNDFLETCLTECMLTDTKLVHILMKFMSLCIHFSNFTNDMFKDENKIDIDLVKKTIQNSELKFHTILKLLLETLRSFSTLESNKHMIHLIQRLDYNNYYSNYFENNPNLIPQHRRTENISNINKSPKQSIQQKQQPIQQQPIQQQPIQQQYQPIQQQPIQQQPIQQQPIQQQKPTQPAQPFTNNLISQIPQIIQQQYQRHSSANQQLPTQDSYRTNGSLPNNFNIGQTGNSSANTTTTTTTTKTQISPTTINSYEDLRRKASDLLNNNKKQQPQEITNHLTSQTISDLSEKLKNIKSNKF
ncbi:hypothetical protein DICPUDRAFT_53526 [Dictyostelium purpureum]|uniref:Spindle pole body component n=1 Tax=Dictyostelium purpureum TaxID=5786 RepID=F0ZDB7_DICPU|nr:uncharacterized protein DICPUDRAFT_53526 [Dictyostelium purpureum]EGC38081.1 hypothetical protein DICPUDRAFT_53526 [Dictyostelium purpureum]|eukprot:XP_003285388.1 hypothetical protein DICPUDRAFT_53526 [Dictyostelium purpureum]